MAFLYPGFLWALLALAVPILIHLFQLRRYKRIEFPDVRMLQAVSKQTRQQKKIRHWLVLLARCLALAMLVLAFAQPYVPSGPARVKAGQRAISVYLDDSYSMDGRNAQGRLLDQARAAAQDAISSHSASDRYQVITGGLEGRQQMLTGRDEAMEAASRAEVKAFSRPLSQVMARQREALATSEAPVKRMLVFTDLQRSITDVDKWTSDRTISTVIVPFTPSTQDNLSVDSAWFESPVRRIGQAEALHVRVRNRGTTDLEDIPVRLAIDGRQRALASTAVPAGAYADTVLRFTNDLPGPHWGEVSINDQPVTFDDRLHIAYRTADRLRVLLVGGADQESDQRIEAVFTGDSALAFTQQDHRTTDPGAFTRSDLVILNALPTVGSGIARSAADFVENGGSLAFFPATQQDATGASQLLGELVAGSWGARDTTTLKVDRFDAQLPFFRDIFNTIPRNVDLPVVRVHHSLRMPAAGDMLLRLQNGDPFLGSVRHGKGTVYTCTSPLNEKAGTFTAHALFVTSLLRMAELSRPAGALYHMIGDGEAIALESDPPAGDVAVHLTGPGGLDLVPELRRTPAGAAIVLHDLDLPDGPYALTAGTDTLMTLALDLSRAESDLSTYTAEELRAAMEQRGLAGIEVLDSGTSDIALSLDRLDQGVKLWKWAVLLGLLFLVIETLLLRWRT